jgi:uncharacterized protein YjiS (DUF1127 family)
MSCTAHDTMTDCQAISSPSGRSVNPVKWVGDTVRIWRERTRERQAFAELDYRDLRDIGLSRWEVEGELAKPFWRG